MIEKRFQVFVSSTSQDLKDERQAALKAILELDHMPAGMELFPASDDSAWQLIKDVIDSSDYYVLLIGGRYGSLDETGIGYTEKEYDYSVSNKKAVIPLLHRSPDNLPRDKTEAEPEAWEMLKNFRKKVENSHTCVYWESAADLRAKLIVGLTSAVKKRPAVGWVRADTVPTEATLREVLDLKAKLTEAQKQLEMLRTEAPPGTEDLMQGEDLHSLEVTFGTLSPDFRNQSYTVVVKPTWNEIFAGIAPALINEATDTNLRRTFANFVDKLTREAFSEDEDLKDHGIKHVALAHESDVVDTCLVQLRALGLIRESDKKRSVTDTETYWTLTPFGDRRMVQLRALHREPAQRRRLVEKSTSESKGVQA